MSIFTFQIPDNYIHYNYNDAETYQDNYFSLQVKLIKKNYM